MPESTSGRSASGYFSSTRRARYAVPHVGAHLDGARVAVDRAAGRLVRVNAGAVDRLRQVLRALDGHRQVRVGVPVERRGSSGSMAHVSIMASCADTVHAAGQPCKYEFPTK
jgi:hypothetical protein